MIPSALTPHIAFHFGCLLPENAAEYDEYGQIRQCTGKYGEIREVWVLRVQRKCWQASGCAGIQREASWQAVSGCAGIQRELGSIGMGIQREAWQVSGCAGIQRKLASIGMCGYTEEAWQVSGCAGIQEGNLASIGMCGYTEGLEVSGCAGIQRKLLAKYQKHKEISGNLSRNRKYEQISIKMCISRQIIDLLQYLVTYLLYRVMVNEKFKDNNFS